MDHAGPTTVLSFVAHIAEVESASLIKTGTEAKDVICIWWFDPVYMGAPLEKLYLKT